MRDPIHHMTPEQRIPVTYDAPDGWAILHCLLHGIQPVVIWIPIDHTKITTAKEN